MLQLSLLSSRSGCETSSWLVEVSSRKHQCVKDMVLPWKESDSDENISPVLVISFDFV